MSLLSGNPLDRTTTRLDSSLEILHGIALMVVLLGSSMPQIPPSQFA